MKEYSEPRMHTAEHLLNRTVSVLLGCGRAFSSHIERTKSKCDYRFSRDLTSGEKAEIEKLSASFDISHIFIPNTVKQSKTIKSNSPKDPSAKRGRPKKGTSKV